MLIVHDVDGSPDELVDELDGKIRDGEIESANALARALVQRRDDCASDVVLEASRRGIADVVRGLIEAGADVNKADDEGWTPLYTVPLRKATRLWSRRWWTRART
jgi:ankyrin repeat protein